MKKFILFLSLICIIEPANAQIEGTELGIDGTFWASQVGGTAGIGAKYGMKFGEFVILGPSFRYQRSWSNQLAAGTKSGFNVWGGGGFIHARFFDAVFIGAEVEILRSPFSQNGLFGYNPKWVPTCLLGGGLSMNLGESDIRLNVGIMYDILDIPNTSNPESKNPNSPLQPYLTKSSIGTVIPIIYRIAFFIPLT
ncbi:MAG: hypothetical protein QNK77_09210 [Crocinitomicaceae bacterium]